ncbi:MAG: 23S rRNA (guanosine(2251)-2'-O)-methyltransferase RlmB [Oligoflexia bacterium]|nr:23S rRNA (guanosine(2251)-2'-O)-methyltransferase RlmB [Oligoflexia bacterium]
MKTRTVPGIHSVYEALITRPHAVSELWVKEDSRLTPELDEILELAGKNKIKIKRLHAQRLDQIVSSHQGVIAYLNDSPSWPDIKRFKECKQGLVIACDGLEDPRNLASIVRSCWNLGCMGVLTTESRSVSAYAPSAQKVASGGFEHVPYKEVTNLNVELEQFKELGFWIYGLDADAKKAIYNTSLAPKAVFLIGSEESGLRKTVREQCDELVSIPSTPKSSSLNAAVACAIAVYEFKRQRALPKN